jgi:4-amino-4-deoxy-L-arabinose transferase-like glycosyltransferase
MSKAAAQTKPVKPEAAGVEKTIPSWAILAVVVLAAGLRMVGLDASPPAINQDEAVHAFEAYCFRTTGQDHYGTPWPTFFRAYGKAEHHSAPFIYLLVPLQAILGMNVWSTRLPPALLGTLNVWLVYLLVRRFYGQRVGLIAAMLLAISPWHIHLSRLAFEVSVCPTLVTLGALLLVLGVSESNRRRALAELGCSGLILGITLWTYNAMRVFVPLLLMGGVILYFRRVRELVRRPGGWSAIAVWVLGFAVGIGPFVWASVKTPQKAWGRAAAVSLFNPNASVGETAAKVAKTYLMHLSPRYLFIEGDPSIIQSVPGYGQLHYFCALLLPLGLWRVVSRWRTESFGR